jgi:LacI family transcriptional regulator
MPTSKDVAKLAGVSHTTVSRAFNGTRAMKNETYEKIMRAADQLNYRPNAIAASLRGCRTKTVGFVISHANVTLFMSIVQELENQLHGKGYRVLISFDGSDPERQDSALRAMVGAQVDSIVFMPVWQEKEQTARALQWMRASKIQFLQIVQCAYEEFSSFLFDDVAATLNGMRHLFQKGHRDILFLGGSNRLEGFYKAYEEQGWQPPIPPDPRGDLPPEVCRRGL